MKKIICFVPTVISVILGIIGWCVLPDVVAVQIGAGGQVSNTAPKLFTILLSVAITVSGSIMCLKNDQAKSRGIILSVVGPVVMILTLIFNL